MKQCNALWGKSHPQLLHVCTYLVERLDVRSVESSRSAVKMGSLSNRKLAWWRHWLQLPECISLQSLQICQLRLSKRNQEPSGKCWFFFVQEDQPVGPPSYCIKFMLAGDALSWCSFLPGSQGATKTLLSGDVTGRHSTYISFPTFTVSFVIEKQIV